MSDEQNEPAALVPLADVLPELSADDYADVREWHAARVRLGEHYEVQDGEYLRLIRDKLTAGTLAGSGLWTRYIRACGMSMSTAEYRIARAEGHPYQQAVPSNVGTGSFLPAPEQVVPEWPRVEHEIARERERAEHAAWRQAYDEREARREAGAAVHALLYVAREGGIEYAPELSEVEQAIPAWVAFALEGAAGADDEDDDPDEEGWMPQQDITDLRQGLETLRDYIAGALALTNKLEEAWAAVSEEWDGHRMARSARQD